MIYLILMSVLIFSSQNATRETMPLSFIEHVKGSQDKKIEKQFIIDSIVVFTSFASNLPFSHDKSEDFCNYDTLKQYAIGMKQVYSDKQNRNLLDSIRGMLELNKYFMKSIHEGTFSLKERKREAKKDCDLSYPINNLFEIHTKGIVIRIGNYYISNIINRDWEGYIETKRIKHKDGKKFFPLLYRYRNSCVKGE